jgi:MFS family permease
MSTQASIAARPLRLLAAVWVPFALGYALSQFFRSVNAVLSPDLVRDLGLDPNQLGLLTSAYLFTFAAFQLPLGLLLDRYGPRRVNAATLVCAAAGALLFAVGQSLAALIAARALIGFGVAICLMAGMQAFIKWFPRSILATLNGWMMAAGGFGALTATAPVEWLLQSTDWRTLFEWLAAITLLSAAVIYWIVPEQPATGRRESTHELLRGLVTVGRDRVFWKMGLLQASASGTSMSLLGLWIAPWLRDVAGMSRPAIGLTLALMAGAMMCGFALWGTLADRLARHGVRMITLYLGGLGVALVMLGLLALGVRWGGAAALTAIIVAYSFFGASGQLVYPMLARRFPDRLAGRFNTANNMLTFVAAFAVQWGMGAVIDLWPAQPERYALEGYRAAFGGAFAIQLMLFLIVLTAREKLE